jgi:tRNA 2-selenouridine synthase
VLAERGVETVDLEGLAGHRGSLFGALPGVEQPSQKMFESRLLGLLDALDPARPVVVEAESSKIGERMTPPAFWGLMTSAPAIKLTAPREARARYLVRTYRDIVADRAALTEAFARLPTHPGRQRLEDWAKLADAGEFEALAEAVMELHYDPAYARAARKTARPRLGTLDLADLTPEDLARAADGVVEMLRRQFRGI